MAQLTYRVSGYPIGTRGAEKRRKVGQTFPNTDEGRAARDAFVKTLDEPATRYDVRLRVNGRLVTKTFTRRKDADAWAKATEAASLSGVAVDPRAGRVRFATYAENWVDGRLVKGKPLAPMTKLKYKKLLRRHICPTFGGASLTAITAGSVSKWHRQLSDSVSHDVAAKSYRLLRAILNTAVDEEKIGKNPCRVRGGGIESAPERPMPQTSEVLALADAIEPRLRALVLLAGFGGLRSGELLGLTRQDVDLANGWVHVRQQAQEITGAGRIVGAPKSDAGTRTVTVGEVVTDALAEHLDRYAQPGDDGLVFTGAKGGPLYRTRLSLQWARACQAVGKDGLHIHDLRHHAATVAAQMPGITTKELMTRIGHVSPRAALIYQHATEERDRAVATYIDEQVAKARGVTADGAQGRLGTQ